MRRQAACSCPEMNVEVHFGCETKTIVFFNVFDVASEMNFSVYFGAGCRLFRGRLTSISGQAAVYFGAGCRLFRGRLPAAAAGLAGPEGLP